MPVVMFSIALRAARFVSVQQDRPLPRRVFAAIAGAAVVLMVGSVLMAHNASPRGSNLVVHQFPGFAIALPNWPGPASETKRYERGGYELASPDGRGRAIRIRWETGDVPEEVLDRIWRAGGMTPGPKETTSVAGHVGARQFIASGTKRVFLTTWTCPEDGRWLSVMTFLDQPKEALLALHESIIASIRCHTEGKRAPVEPVYARFSPPEGWQTVPKSTADVSFVGPAGELVLVAQGAYGRHEVNGTEVPDAIIRTMASLLLSLDEKVSIQRRAMTDQAGHVRKIWVLSGKASDGVALQAELISWYCPVVDRSYLMWFITEGSHDVARGISILAKAECH
jgi:hypothetical protein